MSPTVTAFCPTRNRRNWLPQAIQCFQAQTYENRRMLIVADGEDVQDLIPPDPRIRLVHAGRPATNGEKFNLCCSLADSEILCKWDDDDYSAPWRIADQVQLLQETGKALVGYHTMLFTDGVGWWKYRGESTFCMGTSLCFRREWWERHQFRALQIGSDVFFQAEAASAREVAAVDARELMVATIHAGNTSKRNLGAPYEKVPNYSGPADWRFKVAA